MKRISNLKISEQGLEAKGKNGRWCPILLLQGDMDGACSVYSLMMELILIRTINRSDVVFRKIRMVESPKADYSMNFWINMD